MTTVIKIGPKLPPNAVYIGRSNAKYLISSGAPSRFANPFVIGRDGTRAEVIAKFEEKLRATPELMADVKRSLRGKVLVCWCKPLACHGDVLARIADEADGGRIQ